MQSLADEINGIIREAGVPSTWFLRKPERDSDANALTLEVDGESWGYRFIELKDDFYEAYDSTGQKRRWKMRKTAVDRMSDRIIGMWMAREKQRKQFNRVAYLQELLGKIKGLHQAIQKNIFHVDHTDCRLWIYHDHISVESRSYGIYARIDTDESNLDLIIQSQVETVVESITKVYEAVQAAERAIEAATSAPDLSSWAAE